MVLISKRIIKQLESASGLECIPLAPYNKLACPVSDHADMLFCVLNNTVFCYEDYVKSNKLYDKILQKGYEIVFVENKCDKKYPNDVSLNVLVIGKRIFCNVKYTAKEIITYAIKNGYEIINVKQGYAACSTLAVNDKVAITGDMGMYKALINSGVTVLFTDFPIELEGYARGFMGGASLVTENIVFFFGTPKNMDEFQEIVAFIENTGKSVNYISLDGVYDFGGAKII